MKRSIIYIFATLVAMAASAADYRMWIDNFSINAGETKEVSLNMDNATAVTGFQTDILLPKGLSIKIDEDGYYYIDPTSRSTRSHTIDGSMMPDGAVRVISYATDLIPFKLNTGAVATITLVASADFTGAHAIIVRNTELATPDGGQFFPADETCKVNKQDDVTPGDVNGDGAVDVSDVTALINKILGTVAFDDSVCDVDGNGVVNVSDVTALINLILA